VQCFAERYGEVTIVTKEKQKQESRAAAKKPRDAASVLFG